MELVGVLVYGNKTIVPVVSFEDKYKIYIVNSDDSIMIDGVFNKSDYTDFEHFALVFGKFEPYVYFMKKPVVAKDLRFDTLRKAFASINLPDFVIAIED